MYKLKIVQPKPLKVKFSVAFPPIILANLQEKTVVPLTEEVVVTADDSFDGLSKVTVGAVTSSIDSNITSENIKSGVEILGVLGTNIGDTSDATATPADITAGKTAYIATGKAVGTAPDYWFRELPGNVYSASLNYYLKTVPEVDTSNLSTLASFFNGYRYIKSIPEINTNKGENFYQFCANCYALENIPKLDFSKCANCGNMMYSCPQLINIGGFENLGMGFSINDSANLWTHDVDVSGSPRLTYDSLMNLINNLYDIASKGCKTQQLKLGATNLAKLSEEEIAIATNKGWSVS